MTKPSATATPLEAAGSKTTGRRYQIGPVSVTVRSQLPGIEDGFHAHYGPYERADETPVAFCVDVIAHRSPRSLRRYYHILGNGEELFAVRQPRSVLPHVEWALNLMIARYLPGFLQCHASVMSRDGVGVVFPGSPGQGKSTLAAALLKRGWDYLSDEFALIDPHTHLLHAYPKALCIKQGSFDTLRRIGLPIDRGLTHLKGEKGPVRFINPLDVRPDAVSQPCPVSLVIFPAYRTDGPPMIEPISRAQTVFELTRVSFNFGKFKRRGLHLLADVVSTAGCHRLRSNDLETTCRLVESCLQRCRREVA